MNSVNITEDSQGCQGRCFKSLIRLSRKKSLAGLWAFLSIGLVLLGPGFVFAQQTDAFNTDSLIANNGAVFTGHYNKPIFGHSSFTYNGKKHPLDANQYKAYKHAGTWFKSVQLTSAADPVWMEWLERGKINLYQYISYGAATRVSPRNLPQNFVVWLAQKGSGPLLNVNGVLSTQQKAKENMGRLLADQPDLAAEVKEAPLNTRMVRGLIAAFNQKDGEND